MNKKKVIKKLKMVKMIFEAGLAIGALVGGLIIYRKEHYEKCNNSRSK